MGQGTAGHGTDIRGNLQLGYTVTIDHGSLVGDTQNVGINHINSGAATDGQVITADGAGGAAWEDSAGGGGTAEPRSTELARFRATLSQRSTSVALEAVLRGPVQHRHLAFDEHPGTDDRLPPGRRTSTTVEIPADGDYLIDAAVYGYAIRAERNASVVYLERAVRAAWRTGRSPMTRMVLGSKYIRNQSTALTGISRPERV